MSVADTPATEPLPPNLQYDLAVRSAIGAVVLLAGLGFIFAALPMGWFNGWNALWAANEDLKNNVFLSDALLILVELIAVGGLAYGAYRALQTQTLPGLRAGIVFMAIWIFAGLWLAQYIGNTMARNDPETSTVGWGVMVVLLAAVLGGAGYVYAKVPGWVAFLEGAEHQGFFHANAYKSNQGVRVRRGSIMGILAVGVCGIITMHQHKWFGSDRPDVPSEWYWIVPYAGIPGRTVEYIPLMFKTNVVIPIVLGVLLIWIAWRVVNMPVFADFLVATEAEMNKVSWTNRRRLIQDTIVVLTTVFLFTTFLFVVDVIWIKVLSAPGVRVLMIDPKKAQEEQRETAKW